MNKWKIQFFQMTVYYPLATSLCELQFRLDSPPAMFFTYIYRHVMSILHETVYYEDFLFIPID